MPAEGMAAVQTVGKITWQKSKSLLRPVNDSGV
jgi:hypothetical protein